VDALPKLKDFYQINGDFPWNFRVQVLSKEESFQCYSPSHKLRRVDESIKGSFIFELDPETYQEVSEDFIFRFRVPNHQEPKLILTKNEVNKETPLAMSMHYQPSMSFVKKNME
jgi:hypothetical protein